MKAKIYLSGCLFSTHRFHFHLRNIIYSNVYFMREKIFLLLLSFHIHFFSFSSSWSSHSKQPLNLSISFNNDTFYYRVFSHKTGHMKDARCVNFLSYCFITFTFNMELDIFLLRLKESCTNDEILSLLKY